MNGHDAARGWEDVGEIVRFELDAPGLGAGEIGAFLSAFDRLMRSAVAEIMRAEYGEEVEIELVLIDAGRGSFKGWFRPRSRAGKGALVTSAVLAGAVYFTGCGVSRASGLQDPARPANAPINGVKTSMVARHAERELGAIQRFEKPYRLELETGGYIVRVATDDRAAAEALLDQLLRHSAAQTRLEQKRIDEAVAKVRAAVEADEPGWPDKWQAIIAAILLLPTFANQAWEVVDRVARLQARRRNGKVIQISEEEVRRARADPKALEALLGKLGF